VLIDSIQLRNDALADSETISHWWMIENREVLHKLTAMEQAPPAAKVSTTTSSVLLPPAAGTGGRRTACYPSVHPLFISHKAAIKPKHKSQSPYVVRRHCRSLSSCAQAWFDTFRVHQRPYLLSSSLWTPIMWSSADRGHITRVRLLKAVDVI